MVAVRERVGAKPAGFMCVFMVEDKVANRQTAAICTTIRARLRPHHFGHGLEIPTTPITTTTTTCQGELSSVPSSESSVLALAPFRRQDRQSFMQK